MRFLKRAREAASRISIGTCCQNWLAQHGIALNPYFNERRFCLEDVEVSEIAHIFF